VLDQTSYQKDRLRDTGRWGYTGELQDDPMPIEESHGMGRWIVWVAVIALVILALVMFSGAFVG
jgi:hypothetical protein